MVGSKKKEQQWFYKDVNWVYLHFSSWLVWEVCCIWWGITSFKVTVSQQDSDSGHVCPVCTRRSQLSTLWCLFALSYFTRRRRWAVIWGPAGSLFVDTNLFFFLLNAPNVWIRVWTRTRLQGSDSRPLRRHKWHLQFRLLKYFCTLLLNLNVVNRLVWHLKQTNSQKSVNNTVFCSIYLL